MKKPDFIDFDIFDDIDIHKKNYIALTGGFDSTLTLLQTIATFRNRKADCLIPRNVKPFYVISENNAQQREKEVAAAKQILAAVDERLELIQLHHSYRFENVPVKYMTLNQPIRVLFPAYAIAEENATIILSNIIGDHFFIRRNDVNDMLAAMNRITGKNIRMLNPLCMLDKNFVIEAIMQARPDLLQYIEFIEYGTEPNKSNDPFFKYQSKTNAVLIALQNVVEEYPAWRKNFQTFLKRFEDTIGYHPKYRYFFQ